MGFLDIFRSKPESLVSIPTGSFTVNREGAIISSTVSSRVPAEQLREISSAILQTFEKAQRSGVPVTDVVFRTAAISIRGVELRSGAMIFLTPRRLNPR